MSPRFPSLKPKEVIKAFEKLGFQKLHQTGSHLFLFNQLTKAKIIIPVHPKDLKKGLLLAVIKKAGIEKNIHPHSLRHSYATHLIENGYDINTIQPLLGHNSAETTMRYVHMANPKMIKVVSPYDNL